MKKTLIVAGLLTVILMIPTVAQPEFKCLEPSHNFTVQTTDREPQDIRGTWCSEESFDRVNSSTSLGKARLGEHQFYLNKGWKHSIKPRHIIHESGHGVGLMHDENSIMNYTYPDMGGEQLHYRSIIVAENLENVEVIDYSKSEDIQKLIQYYLFDDLSKKDVRYAINQYLYNRENTDLLFETDYNDFGGVVDVGNYSLY